MFWNTTKSALRAQLPFRAKSHELFFCVSVLLVVLLIHYNGRPITKCSQFNYLDLIWRNRYDTIQFASKQIFFLIKSFRYLIFLSHWRSWKERFLCLPFILFTCTELQKPNWKPRMKMHFALEWIIKFVISSLQKIAFIQILACFKTLKKFNFKRRMWYKNYRMQILSSCQKV